ncbi:MAG: hypothetical protein PHU71_04120 [Candidatus Gracilibacteria bacterium]|nr:hypothetical protein [Candidatus Gracilibacteria bacterium]
MVTQKKIITILLILLAIAGTVYFWLAREGGYMRASLLQGQERFSAAEAQKMQARGWTCYPEVRSKTSDCTETKFGTSCNLLTKGTSNYVCTAPEDQEQEIDTLIGF